MRDEQGEMIVMFEVVLQGDQLKIADEKHYRLLPASEITREDLNSMAQMSD